MWSPYEACKEIVKTEWSSHGSWSGDNAVQLFKKTTTDTLALLKNWSRKEFRVRKRKIEMLINKLERLKGKPRLTMGKKLRRLRDKFTAPC